MSYDEDFHQSWIDKVMPKIIENLGTDVDKARYELTKSIDLIVSFIYYVRLQFENKTNGQNEELFMILKRPRQDRIQLDRIDLLFHNEILFYQTYIRPEEIHFYAKCFYIDERPPVDSMIALENINKRGYYSCPYVYNIPLEYILAGIRELARFHGKGYVMKELQREKFFDIVARLQEVRYMKVGNIYEIYFNTRTKRAVEYLRSQDHDAVFCDKMEALLSNAFEEVMMKTVMPLEPLSTLCHGDPTLGNILFKAEEDGQYRAMLIDFALIRYSTPVIDLSTYLCFSCFSCSNEVRKEKFPEIMRAYHDTLKEYLLDAGIQDTEKYSYNTILEDFRKGALFGFILLSFFLPLILESHKAEVLIEEALRLGWLESAKKQKYIGGDKICKILADTLLHLSDLGCLKHIL